MSNKLTINNSIKSMINTKQDYESPTTNVLELRFKNNILTGSIVQGAGINNAEIDEWGDLLP